MYSQNHDEHLNSSILILFCKKSCWHDFFIDMN